MTKSNLTVRIPDSLSERLRELAKQSGKSLNKTAEEVIEEGLFYCEGILAGSVKKQHSVSVKELEGLQP